MQIHIFSLELLKNADIFLNYIMKDCEGPQIMATKNNTPEITILKYL